METIFLTLTVTGLLAVFTVDTLQKRHRFTNESKAE